MVHIKSVVRHPRKDGFCAVYIRITMGKNIAYIKTDKVVSSYGLDNRKEITDPFVLEYCQRKIRHYYTMLNMHDISHWTFRDVMTLLKEDGRDVNFSIYAQRHIDKLINNGQERTAKNYKQAVMHLERFMGTTKVMFSHLTSHVLNRWIDSLKSTHRAKEMYPVCIRQIFKAAMRELNDEETGLIRIKFNPWLKVDIPPSDRTEKLAITPEECRLFFSAPLPDSPFKRPLTDIGRDVAMMILCLGGINSVDIYNMRKEDYHSGILHYQRAKTKKFRTDGAYMEMRVPPILKPIFEKYLDRTNSEYLFDFHQRHTNSDSFNANVNIGIKKICESMGMQKNEWYSGYTFRHTWGTVAQNDVGATIAEVAFAMNHSAGFNITRGYIKIDFSPAWELNEKVVDFIFFSNKPSKRNTNKQEEQHFKLSYKYLVGATAYHQGKKIAEMTDIGFNNVDEVINRLSRMLPTDIPERSKVLFKITNMDKDQTIVCERTKGKGFR